MGLIRTHWRACRRKGRLEEIDRFFQSSTEIRARAGGSEDGTATRWASPPSSRIPGRTRPASSRATRRATTRRQPAPAGRPPDGRPATGSTPRHTTDRPAHAEPPSGLGPRKATHRPPASRGSELDFGVRRRHRSRTRRCRRSLRPARSRASRGRGPIGPAERADPDRRPAALIRAQGTGTADRPVRCAPAAGVDARDPALAAHDRVVPAFSGEPQVELDVPCTYDFEVRRLVTCCVEDGDVPLELLFNGMVFYAGEGRGSCRPL